MAATQNGTMIEVSDLWKAFGPLQVLKGISLEVPQGFGGGADRPVRLGQIDASALHQSAGDARARARAGG